MVHISNRKLQVHILKKIQSRFTESIVSVKTSNEASLFMNELLGEEEQLMLAKRLVAIYMLAENISSYRIAQVLGLSTSTVNKMRLKLDLNGYTTIVAQYMHKKNHARFWEEIDTLLRLGMPSMGKGRWKWLYDLENKKR